MHRFLSTLLKLDGSMVGLQQIFEHSGQHPGPSPRRYSHGELCMAINRVVAYSHGRDQPLWSSQACSARVCQAVRYRARRRIASAHRDKFVCASFGPLSRPCENRSTIHLG
jgi:hypothetical protein